MSLPKIPPELITAIARGNAVLFVGAGLSKGAGLPDWNDLITLLANELGLLDRDRGDHLPRCADLRVTSGQAGFAPAHR